MGRLLRNEKYGPREYREKTHQEKMMECISKDLKKERKNELV